MTDNTARDRFLKQSLMGETPQHASAGRRMTTGDATASRTEQPTITAIPGIVTFLATPLN